MLDPGTAVGRYIIKRKLAEGGMAEIFLASAVGPEGFSKDVVIKVVRSFLANDSQFVQMFIAEARLASRLNHANVVQIFDFGKHGDSYYLAMEYVHGASLWDLRKRCRERGVPFPPTLAAEIGAQVARGLQYAHSLSDNGQRIGVVHRDVTPHNVLLSFEGAVKLTDFGIAKATTTQTAPGMLKGKFAYMAPEQSRGDKVDARTDLFALGIVVWELLTGGRLFDGDSDLAVLRAVQESFIAPPSRLNPDVPAELSDVVMKALARQPEERFQSAFELEKALANYVLRNAKSVDDTSVSLFLQQIYREEFAAAFSAPDTFGSGLTHQRQPATITATPAPQGAPGDSEHSVATQSASVSVEGSRRLDTAALVTSPHEVPAKAVTEHMPALKRASRRLDPLPVAEPSIIVRPSAGVLPEVAQNEFEVPKHSRKAPLIALLGVVVVGLAFALFSETSSTPEAAKAPDVPKVAEVTTSLPPAPSVMPPAPVNEEEVDAGLPEVAAVPAAPLPVEKAVPMPAPAPVVRKMGTLLVRAVPYATVVVQGKSYEVTGVQKVPAPVGTYEITLVHPKRKLKERVTVQANQITSVSFAAD